MPVVEAADRENLPLVFVDYFDARKWFADPANALTRHYVAADGRMAPSIPCPLEPACWHEMVGGRALELARLRRAGHRSVAGLLLDLEDYAGTGEAPCGGTYYCFCDVCFATFARATGQTGLVLEAPQRASWLAEAGLVERYRRVQDEAAANMLAGIRSEIDAVAPDFLLAAYPWPFMEFPDRAQRVPWDFRLAQGLGTVKAPFLLFSENTYIWGYDPAMERHQEVLRRQGLHFLAVTGFNLVPSERVWWPDEMAQSAYWASRRSNGYWIYVGDWALLSAASGQSISALFGDRPEAWVTQFTRMNHVIASRKKKPFPLLPLAPLGNVLQLTSLFNPQHASGTGMYVRPWSDIGLPWQGGEWIVEQDAPGAWLSFQRSLSKSDRYEVSAWLTTGPDRAIVQLYVDDKVCGQPVDLHQTITTPGERTVLGYADLHAGSHTFRLAAEGKDEQSTGYGLGLRAANIERVGTPPSKMSVIGPFDNTGEGFPGYDAAYSPEHGIDLDAEYPGKGGQPVRWRQLPVVADGYLNLVSAFSESKDCVAYCLTYVYCPTDGPRNVLLGSDDGGKLFVNGQFVWGEASNRSAVRDQNAPRGQFHRGWNEILFKVLQTTGQWGLYLRVQDSSGEMQYSPTLPTAGPAGKGSGPVAVKSD